VIVIVIVLDEARVYAYPYDDFKKELSARSQELLDEQHKQAQRNSEIVVFVRDDHRKKLVSYNCPWERSALRPNSSAPCPWPRRCSEAVRSVPSEPRRSAGGLRLGFCTSVA